MVATTEIQQDLSMTGADSIHIAECYQRVASAERELGAFLKAVESLYGDDAAAGAAEQWVSLMETAPLPISGGRPNWRHITILASSRFAMNYLEYKPPTAKGKEENDAE